jgi:midasin
MKDIFSVYSWFSMKMDESDRNENRHHFFSQVSSSLRELPEEILEVMALHQSTQFLNALATEALKPRSTLPIFITYESIFADICARWIEDCSGNEQRNEVIEGFARVLPLAPHLSTFLEKYLRLTSSENSSSTRIRATWNESDGVQVDGVSLQRILLATFRLIGLNRYTFSKTISGPQIQNYFQHADPVVRYLSVRIFCLVFFASDAKLESMLEKHVGRTEGVIGDYDGRLVDFGFLSLLEEKRLNDAKKALHENPPQLDHETYNFTKLSDLICRYSNTFLPRPNGPPARPSSMILTSTTSANMEVFAKALLTTSPILLHGLAGSGKTSLVNDFARELGADSHMVTLHLNEQTDAKMLIGMYATGSTPGSFTWRAGVLTTAVREGRWVFIEDLDRAPNEVISVILPLIERGEILVPSRGEVVKAGPGFKLLASIRTSVSVTGEENPPPLHMLGARLWQRVPVRMPTQNEFREIIDGSHPILHQFLDQIIAVYDRLYSLSQKPSFASRSRSSLGRPISPRDLLKWCRRLEAVLVAAGSKSASEPINDGTIYAMFLEATDCFASSLQTEESRHAIISAIAEEMHIDPQRVEHFINAHIPKYEESETELLIGRVHLPRRTVGRVSKSQKKLRPFANTTHAKRLLEQVGMAVKMAEPVLLVGETGIGKTTVVQQLADTLGYKLTAVNLSQQSEVGDLLGGFKPVNVRSLAIPLKDEFDDLFASTGISISKNQKYVDQLGKSVAKGQWNKASKLWREAPKIFDRIISELKKKDVASRTIDEQPMKRRKTESRLQSLLELKPRWDQFSERLDQFDVQLSGGSKGFAFTFIEGNIVKAARNGDWVLLDEINLASPDTLEGIADLLHSGSGGSPSILLSETGEIERVKAHPNFRIFGAMNPATDVGKRDLPMGLRSRFTEIYVESPDRSLDDLLGVIKAYLKGTSTNDERAAHDVARLYINTKRLADEKRLVDGANQVPHFSLRTLTRVLSYVIEITPLYGLRRALYEGFAMGFLTLLNRESEQMLMPLIDHHLLESHGNARALLSQTPKHPEDGRQYARFMSKAKDRQYWLLQGMEQSQVQVHYIRTPSVERNMLNLVRATSTRRFPVLVQGPTSSGKTSMIEYLAKFSGNRFVRINNHEHTDLQEYLGTYVSGSDGQLRFQEGLLVQALRQGHWIVLDELNLAPTDVLEALNRLLDDNRELLIPETQEIVRPHENFMLFATQNPPGLYGGRKTLSRAFRNRFLELHFDDIPQEELQQILEYRSQKVAPSDCKRIVDVYKELSTLRQSSRLFEQKDSFATLRDLFRWALRDADNREQLAANGYMLLAERVRNPQERLAVKNIIEKVMKVKIEPDVLYGGALSPEIQAYNATSNSQGVVWTQAMRRLYVLVAHALRNNEPVLLVGETGCGKTTVCQMLAEAFGKELYIVNAHQNTETGDLIGAQRPVRNRAAILEQLRCDITLVLDGLNRSESFSDDEDALLSIYNSLSSAEKKDVPVELLRRIEDNQRKAKALFEWSDGSLVQALREGQFFLLDEISLADDSVLERLNSVLETQRTILLAEKGTNDSFIKAADGFQFFATMNPGGDYGKRELSPALRNRFTEIWVPSLSEHEDVFQIVESKLSDRYKPFSTAMVHFADWFGQTYRSSSSTSISVRDVLAWVKFINGYNSTDPYFAVLHGAAMVYVDTLGANPAALLAIDSDNIQEERDKCLVKLSSLLKHDIRPIYFRPVDLVKEGQHFSVGAFSIPIIGVSDSDIGFAFEAPTTKLNAMRVIRALQVQKPILIEGSPGVGKTTLIAALARACNKPLTRINLSEQTDLMDLFGSDIPVEGAEAGHFSWRDAPFLQAMQKGEWVLLDEMNLASQSVLEGLNACLDHRGEVYISELDQTFKRHPSFSVFAAQNPHHQGGGRKGLPSSFVNRFTVVYADIFRNDDLQLICKHNFPVIPDDLVATIIKFVSQLEYEILHRRRFGLQGGPWEFNLRDILRWLQLLSSSDPFLSGAKPTDFLNLIFRQRFRTTKDRQELDRVFSEVFKTNVPFRHIFHNISTSAYQVGLAYLPRDTLTQRLSYPKVDHIGRLAEVESVMICVQKNIPCILVGSTGTGKTTILEHIAAMSGKSLTIFALNADIDTMDLVGGFEQVDPQRAASAFLQDLHTFISCKILASLPAELPEEALSILQYLQDVEMTSPSFFSSLAQDLLALRAKTSISEFEDLSATCQQLAETPMVLENARFEWVDGILVKALEEGKWLVLDNANLCSASVLDRLNSLLEPNGFLSINEHCGPDGQAKIVRPHPNFRIFLTMDARYGELSRAMRNRAIEIFLEPLPKEASHQSPATSPEASMQRFKNLMHIVEETRCTEGSESELVHAVALDNLSWSDLELLPRFFELVKHNYQVPDPSRLYDAYIDLYRSPEYQGLRTEIGNILSSLALKGGLIPAGFRDAQVSDCAVPLLDSHVLIASKIIHPLQNTPLASLIVSTQGSEQVYWLATILELMIEITGAQNAQGSQATRIETLKPSKMNRLQRSLVKGRISSVAKDSTTNVATFLRNILEMLKYYLQTHSQERHSGKEVKKAFDSLLSYWWDTFDLATSARFEETTFQAHLAIGMELLPLPDTVSEHHSIIQHFHKSLLEDFSAGFQLTTGLSMEIMWKSLRPILVPSRSALEHLAQMEALSRRFDALKWKLSISLPDLCAIQTSLVKAYQVMLTGVNGAGLIETLSQEMLKLENGMGNDETCITPFLTTQFDALRQYKTLENMRLGRHNEFGPDITILANHPTTSEMRLTSAGNFSWRLQAIDSLLGTSGRLVPISGALTFEILDKMGSFRDVDLKSLKLLESELPIMAEKLAHSTSTICRNQFIDLNSVLSSLILEVLTINGVPVPANTPELPASLFPSNYFFQDMAADNHEAMIWIQHSLSVGQAPSHFQEVFKEHLGHALIAIQLCNGEGCSVLELSSLAWIQFALGCLKLYVPNRSFDPDKRQRLERQRHENSRLRLEKKLAALKKFEKYFSGQDSNMRCQLLEEEINDLGDAPLILQEIYRPDESEMDQLQGEFSNLLKSVVLSDVASVVREYFSNREGNVLQQLKLTQSNVAHIIRRLCERFSAYRDLTVPVVNMLRALQIGLSLAFLVSGKVSPNRDASVRLSNMTPFLGGGPVVLNEETKSNRAVDNLHLIATTAAIENLALFDLDSRDILLKSFHNCYDQWIERLESDRVEAESKTGLYRYRGSAEDVDEDDQQQFNELFPAYDNNTDNDDGLTRAPTTFPPSHIVRDISVEITKVHAEVFLGRSTASASLINLIRKASQQIGQLHESEGWLNEQSMTPSLLPGALLLLNDQIDALNHPIPTAELYNFYTDPNLPETRKLVDLIHRIQSRFSELQKIDEIGHMQPLEDVIVSCRELLQFRHTEPLAKIITKVEQLHTFIHEWQFGGWASRANSAITHYDDLTATIVSWRRVELSTWAKLFDMETQKCENDAQSWFFIAYKVVIAAPLQMHESSTELQEYAQKLLKDLEVYFSSAIMGQFIQRLQLLKQLSKHLEIICLDLPALSVIYTALSNFVSLYSRYEKPVHENLKRGRISLEKSMKDVLLLASWKDTNIVALRDSAKRSHHKLFKIVRKFRMLLGQPMEFILKQGLPDETPVENASTYDAATPFPSVDLYALALCASSVPNWSRKSKRFINVSKTVSIMADAGSIPESAVDGALYLDFFLGNIVTSTAELQKSTPSMLTDGNKDIIKHLKSRKRKLFADTLKELRQMGIKFNLGTDSLAQQDSISIVLASVSILPGNEISSLEYYFHKSVDLSPRVREAVRQHSEDLSTAEVARSTGFLEGILHTVMAQRNIFSSTVLSLKKLITLTRMAEGLWAPDNYDIRVGYSAPSHEKLLRWVPRILSVAVELIKVHSKLGKFESKDICEAVSSWQDRFSEFTRRWDALTNLPEMIVSTNQLSLLADIEEGVRKLKGDISDMKQKRPNLTFVLDQILPWLIVADSASQQNFEARDITDLDQTLSAVCDSVLLSMEKHKKVITELPTSTEESAWFVRTETCLAESIKVLHCETITRQIKEAFKILPNLRLDDNNTSKTAGALFAVALPILQQYSNTLEAAMMRYGGLHRATCKMSYILSKIFVQIATQGFCTPSENSAGQDGQTEKLEGGTGLGDGDGAEDISKDIQEDEDLDELAQEPNTDKGNIEDEKDAVDMADGEMEGEMGDADEKGDDEEGSGDENDEENGMDEEAGDVDDLDPTAVDEKMWDGDGEESDKDQEGNDSKGKQDKNEQVAAQESNKEAPEAEDGDDGDDGEEEEMAGAEQGEEVRQDEIEKHDPHVQEGEALDLPEDMELDADEEHGSDAGSDDGMNDLSDVEDTKEGEEVANDGKEESENDNGDNQDNEDVISEMDIVNLDEEPEGEGEKTEEAGEKVDQEAEEQQPEVNDEGLLRDRNDEANADADNAIPSDVQGIGEDQDDSSTDNKTESASKAQRDDGGKGGDSSEKKDEAAEDGEKGRQANGNAPQNSEDETQDSVDAQPFKKLGDALEKWHRQQTKIREAADSKEQGQDQNIDMNAESSEYQHLQDEEAEADTQALGTATEEQASALDESMAVDSESKEMPDQFQPDEVDESEVLQDDVMDMEDERTKDPEASDAYEGRAGAMIKQANPELNLDLNETHAQAQDELEDDVKAVDTQLESTHLDPSLGPNISLSDARSQWENLSAVTRPLSLSLTEQLRLILSPTLATKMRGDFRTGKRLNIKRIIPYIASSFKRDKIWMRRSVPSKRSYQILLAVDDSKSMVESGSGALALETLVMVSKSLSMLEVGEICVVSFGEDVRVAHDFSTPFSEDAGPALLQNFTFAQNTTNITTLINSSISLLRSARQRASSSPSDLWQLQLIISDGVTPASSHADIRQLLRTAMEERIMIVFVVVDDVSKKGKGESVMDLRQVQFVEGKVRIERYLDTFPFQYYVVVGDVKELPAVLATLLRQWFAEVVDSTG